MPTVSVIIPSYNREALIAETLNTIINQTRAPDEIIVVDDGSTDRSVDVIKEFAPRISLIRQANAGPAVARNKGLSVSQGEFVQFFDSDDLCAANKIEVQMAAIEATGADVAYCPWVKAELSEGLARCEPFVIQQRPLPAHCPPHRHFVRGWVTVFQTCLVRRELLNRVGGFEPRLMPSEDSELMFRMLLSGAKLVHTPETIVLYRVHASNQISGSALGSLRRARDWALYKNIVAERIHANSQMFTPLERKLWAIDAVQANRLASALLGKQSHEQALISDQLIAFVQKQWRRVLRRLCGTRMDPVYGEGPMTDHQRKLIHALGYTATSAY
jgi:glycosyltransferase involved in cell wall biosynthesis